MSNNAMLYTCACYYNALSCLTIRMYLCVRVRVCAFTTNFKNDLL